MTPGSQPRLARRLRQLRDGSKPKVPQAQLAAVLGVSVATVSADENLARGIQDPRLAGYATFYAAPRFWNQSRLAKDSELTQEEREAKDMLLAELKALRDDPEPPAPAVVAGAERGIRRIWKFVDPAPVWIVCGEIPKGEPERSPLADADRLNYTELFSYADVDALVDLFGHIRAENPDSDVRFLKSTDIVSDNLSGHLILLGGLGWNQATEWFSLRSQLPVRQVEHPDYPEGEIFEVVREGEPPEQHVPQIGDDPQLGLIEDIGLFVRMRSPYNRACTLTICNGVYSRGVLGAVRFLIDRNLRRSNEEYILDRFGFAEEFGVLMRVPVLKGKTITPDLWNPNIPIFTWPERT